MSESSAHLSDSVVVMRELNVIYGRCTGVRCYAVGIGSALSMCSAQCVSVRRGSYVYPASVVLSGWIGSVTCARPKMSQTIIFFHLSCVCVCEWYWLLAAAAPSPPPTHILVDQKYRNSRWEPEHTAYSCVRIETIYNAKTSQATNRVRMILNFAAADAHFHFPSNAHTHHTSHTQANALFVDFSFRHFEVQTTILYN